MSRLDIWKRLLWKEYREDRWPLFIALLTMTALYTLARAYVGRPGATGQVLLVLASGSVHLAIAVWGATKGDSKRGSTQFEFTHLPTSPLLEWTASVGVPTLAAALLGLLYGWLYQHATGRYGLIPMPVLGALDLGLTYAVCYFMAALVSLWAGVLIGMAQIMGGTLIPVWQTEMPMDAYTFLLAARTLAASLVGALILAWLCRKASPLAQKGAALGAAVLILYGPIVVQGLPEWVRHAQRPRSDAAAPTSYGPHSYRTPDFAVRVEEDYPQSKAGHIKLKVTDYGRDVELSRTFRQDIRIIGALRDGRVFLAQQTPGSRTVSVVVWDYAAGRTSTPARFTTRAGALVDGGDDWSRARAVSPGGRYVLLEMGGLIGTSADLWIVDLRTGRSNVALLAGFSPAPPSLAWTSDSVLLDNGIRPMQIDLRTLRGSALILPVRQEASR